MARTSEKNVASEAADQRRDGGHGPRRGAGAEAPIDAGRLSRALFEESDPVRALQIALEAYARSLQTRNLPQIHLRAPDRAAIRMPRQVRSGSRPCCRATLAFLKDAVHLATGSRVEAVEERCIEQGHARCVHQIHWDRPAA